MAWLIGWGRDVSLTRQFGLLSLVVVGLITTTFGLVISHSLKQDLLDREWSTTADFIRTEAIHSLTPSDFADPEHPAAQARFVLDSDGQWRMLDFTVNRPLSNEAIQIP